MNTKERTKPGKTRSRRRGNQDVTYTPAKPFNRNRFLLQLATVAAVVLALFLGMLIFFKVGEGGVKISGTVKYDPYDILKASGISEKENLITLNKNRISARILDEFHYVDTVQIDKQLPDTVVIQITELEVVYAIQDQEDGWWLMSAGGKIVDSCSPAVAQTHTRILGVKLAAPELGSQAAAYEPPQEPDANGVTVPVTVYAREKLEVAVSTLGNLEREGFVGTIATVDVSNIGDIQLWYSNRFQMLLGDSTDLPKKLNALSQAMDTMEDYETGVLDASFTVWPDQVGHSPLP